MRSFWGFWKAAAGAEVLLSLWFGVWQRAGLPVEPPSAAAGVTSDRGKVTSAESGPAAPKLRLTVRLPETAAPGETVTGKGWLTYESGRGKG